MRKGNAKMITVIFNALYEEFGSKIYQTVQEHCPNLTCCFDCCIDDFYHVEGCKLLSAIEEYHTTKNKIRQSKRKEVVKNNIVEKRLKAI